MHTPGPWRVAEAGYIRARDDALTAKVFDDPHWKDGVAEANAALIAAAPDLLAACNRIARGECTCHDGGPGFQCEVCEARVAIARARVGSENHA